MVYRLRAYGSVAELLGSVSTEIDQTRRQIQQVREASNDIRKRSERAKRLQQAFLNGSKTPAPTASQGIRIGDLDVVVNAGSDDELLALELMIHTHNERIVALQKIQETLTKLEAKGQPELLNEISCLVIENDGVPRKLMFQDKNHFESGAVASLFPRNIHGFTAGTDSGSHPEQSKLGEVQLEMASIVHESTDHADHPTRNEEELETPQVISKGRLGNILSFVTAKPLHT